jgi:hypothetical protein
MQERLQDDVLHVKLQSTAGFRPAGVLSDRHLPDPARCGGHLAVGLIRTRLFRTDTVGAWPLIR